MNKKLVTYFSASGVTAGLAKKVAEAAAADLYEIKPEKPYTQADLNWNDKKSRSTVEMNDPSIRPKLVEQEASRIIRCYLCRISNLVVCRTDYH